MGFFGSLFGYAPATYSTLVYFVSPAFRIHCNDVVARQPIGRGNGIDSGNGRRGHSISIDL
jgi:hypothetical protein